MITTLVSSQLRAGDLVLEYGMRIRLHGEPAVYDHDSPAGPTYNWPGQVENLQEVLDAGFVPRSFLCENIWDPAKGWTLKLTGRWTVQGNDLARWRVERPAPADPSAADPSAADPSAADPSAADHEAGDGATPDGD
jgi:hypothetical protein